MRSRFTIATLSGKTNRPPPGCCATAEIAASMSVALRTDAVTTSMPSDGPMDCRRRAKEADPVLAGAEFDRIGNKHKHHWHRTRELTHRRKSWTAHRQNHIGRRLTATAALLRLIVQPMLYGLMR